MRQEFTPGLCSSAYPETPLGEPRPDRNSPGERAPGTATLAQQPLHRSLSLPGLRGSPIAKPFRPLQAPPHSDPLPRSAGSTSHTLPQALGAAAVTSPQPCPGPALGRAQQLCPSPAGWLGVGVESGHGAKRAICSPRAWPPAQTLALPQGLPLGPLSPCQEPGRPRSPPRLGHSPHLLSVFSGA